MHPPRGEEAGEQPPAGGPLGAAGPLARPGGTAEPLGLGPCVSPGGGRWVKGWLGAGRGSAHSVQCTHWPAQRPPLSWPPHEPGPHTLPPQIHLCRKKVASRSCHFYNNVEGEGLVGPPSPGVSWEWGGAAGGLAWVSRPDDFAPWAVPLGTLSWVRQVPALSPRWGLCWTAHRWAHRGPGRPPWEGLLARLAPVSGAWLSGGPHRPRQEELPQPELRAASTVRAECLPPSGRQQLSAGRAGVPEGPAPGTSLGAGRPLGLQVSQTRWRRGRSGGGLRLHFPSVLSGSGARGPPPPAPGMGLRP